MKILMISVLILLQFSSCDFSKTKTFPINLSQAVNPDSIEVDGNKQHANFKLRYAYTGLGSGMGSMQPVFETTGGNYRYTLEQNSFYVEPDKLPQVICNGTLRVSSIDSIVSLVKDLKDTIVYKTDPKIMSGGIHYLWVRDENIDVTFDLHNASDPIAQKIVDILNSNIPADKKKLWLFNLPDKDEK